MPALAGKMRAIENALEGGVSIAMSILPFCIMENSQVGAHVEGVHAL